MIGNDQQQHRPPRPERGRRVRCAAALAVALTLAALSGCTVASAGTGLNGARSAPSAGTTRPADPTPVASAREGRPAESERIHFVPSEVVLPGRARAEVRPAETVNGVLKVPEEVQHVGWWDGSAYAGDPFGSTVIAGHVDSASEGIGFFARLLKIEVGDTVTLRSGERELSYRITAVRKVARKALSADGQTFDQTGNHRLVLITCTGTFRRDRGGYDSNLVVVGTPVGLAR